MIGDISGCLEVIQDCEDVRPELDLLIRELAESEWNGGLSENEWCDFGDEFYDDEFEKHYKLDDDEKFLFHNKQSMPETFIDKYMRWNFRLLEDDDRFLYHKTQPDTRFALRTALYEKQIYKVRCKRCGRTFFTDKTSFGCVKWRSCGIECLKSTVDSQLDYSKSIYSFDSDSFTLQALDSQLVHVSDMISPLVYGYNKSCWWAYTKIFYISDMHLEHHLEKYAKDEDFMIRSICEKLVSSLSTNSDVVIFDGDTAESFDLAIKFYSQFMSMMKVRSFQPDVYAVLGNHEYIPFDSVNACVSAYNDALIHIGITLLHNTYVVKDDYVIFGGTGFAKYSDTYNANNLCCCRGFTRDDEIYETGLFETAYHEALQHAEEHHLRFLCVSHYPISSCLNNHFDRNVIYFTGHTHHRESIVSEDVILYADNQVGYKSNNFKFARAIIGKYFNPYSGLSDGVYQTSVDDYLLFCRYLNESVGNGGLLYQRCSDGYTKMYVVIQNGFYGFFLIRTGDTSQGISIVNGSRTKKITNSTDISWICDNFSVVLSKYLQLLVPLRTVQEKLSSELKDLGLDGTIHGCIVDIDFYHHIMINPTDGTFTYYYSPEFGSVQDFLSFPDVIKSLKINSGFQSRRCSHIKALYGARQNGSGYMLSMKSNQYLLGFSDSGSTETVPDILHDVSRTDGAYGVSRKVNSLQHIFDNRILRDFDLRLTETQQSSYRDYSYVGSSFSYDYEDYEIIEDNGTDIVVAKKLRLGCEDKNELVVPNDEAIRRFSIVELDRKAYWHSKKKIPLQSLK